MNIIYSRHGTTQAPANDNVGGATTTGNADTSMPVTARDIYDDFEARNLIEELASSGYVASVISYMCDANQLNSNLLVQ